MANHRHVGLTLCSREKSRGEWHLTASTIVRKNVRRVAALFFIAALPHLPGSLPAGAQEARRVSIGLKLSDVAVPEGVPLGQFRRITQPFTNWELVCDENLVVMEKICSITQSFISEEGGIVFNWSMLSDAEGKPIMVLRTPAAIGKGGKVVLSFPDEPEEEEVELTSCTEHMCLGSFPVGPLLRRHIDQGSQIGIRFGVDDAHVALSAPLEGIDAALDALR